MQKTALNYFLLFFLFFLPLKFGRIVSYNSLSYSSFEDLPSLFNSYGASFLLLFATLFYLFSPLTLGQLKRVKEPFGALLLFCLLVYIVPSTEGSYREHLSLMLLGGSLFAVYFVLQMSQYEREVLIVLSLSFVFLSLYGLYQYFWGFDLALTYLDEAGTEALTGRLRHRLNQGLLSASFTYSNHFAAFWVLLMPISFYKMWTWAQQRGDKKSFGLIILVAVLCTCAFILTKSRAAVFALALSTLATVSLGNWARRRVFLAVGLGLSVVLVLLMLHHGNFGSILARVEYYRVALSLFLENPFGVNGLGEFYPYYTQHKEIGAEETKYPHSIILMILSQAGIYGLVLFGLFLFFCFKLMCKNFSSMETQMVFAGCFAWLSHSCLDFNINVPASWTLFLLLMLWGGRHSWREAVESSNDKWPYRSLYILGVILILCVATRRVWRESSFLAFSEHIKQEESLVGLKQLVSVNQEQFLWTPEFEALSQGRLKELAVQEAEVFVQEDTYGLVQEQLSSWQNKVPSRHISYLEQALLGWEFKSSILLRGNLEMALERYPYSPQALDFSRSFYSYLVNWDRQKYRLLYSKSLLAYWEREVFYGLSSEQKAQALKDLGFIEKDFNAHASRLRRLIQ